jgi:hypothetical protein
MVRVFSIVRSALNNVKEVHYESVVYGHYEQHTLAQDPNHGDRTGCSSPHVLKSSQVKR